MNRKVAAAGAGSIAVLLLAAAMPGAVLGAGSGDAAGAAALSRSPSVRGRRHSLPSATTSPTARGSSAWPSSRCTDPWSRLLCRVDPGRSSQGTLIGAAITSRTWASISAGGHIACGRGVRRWVGTTVAPRQRLRPREGRHHRFRLGLLGTIIFYGRMAVDSVLRPLGDARAEKADIAGVALMNWLPGQLLLFVISFVPVFRSPLNGPGAVQDALTACRSGPSTDSVIAGGILRRSASP